MSLSPYSRNEVRLRQCPGFGVAAGDLDIVAWRCGVGFAPQQHAVDRFVQLLELPQARLEDRAAGRRVLRLTASLNGQPTIRAPRRELSQLLDETEVAAKQISMNKALVSADFASVLPEAELARHWNEMRAIAKRERVGLLQGSGAIALHVTPYRPRSRATTRVSPATAAFAAP